MYVAKTRFECKVNKKPLTLKESRFGFMQGLKLNSQSSLKVGFTGKFAQGLFLDAFFLKTPIDSSYASIRSSQM
jgi:hypothetical protein